MGRRGSLNLLYLLLIFLFIATLIADDFSSMDDENLDDDDNDWWLHRRRVVRRPRYRRPIRRRRYTPRRRWVRRRRPIRWRRPVRRPRWVRRPRPVRRPVRRPPSKPSRTLSSPVKKNSGLCYKRSYGRGVGRVMKCDPRGSHTHYQAGLCYKPCARGYRGVGPVCWQDCPSGFRDHGAFCRKGRRTYGRGIGIIGKHNCQRRYRRTCERHWGLWYQKCKPGYVNHGCCICSQVCPRGMRDIGISCAKKSYGRGVGRIPTSCKPYGNGWTKSGLLCYKKCKKPDFYGVGPVCWHNCKAYGQVNCGAMCADSSAKCAMSIVKKVFNTLKVAAQAIATKGSSLPKGIITLVETYNFPICGSKTSKTVSQVVGVLAKGAGFLAGKLGKNDEDNIVLDNDDKLELINDAFDVSQMFDDDVLQYWDETKQQQLQDMIDDESNFEDDEDEDDDDFQQ